MRWIDWFSVLAESRQTGRLRMLGRLAVLLALGGIAGIGWLRVSSNVARGNEPPEAVGTDSVEPTRAAELYHKNCQSCHGKEGNGNGMRRTNPELPDFASAQWQGSRSDAQLLVSILEGKGTSMPAFDHLSPSLARGLVAHVRTFAPTAGRRGGLPAAEFEKRFRELRAELESLRREFQEAAGLTRSR
jgi:mono/diheme cytochrome c family protein